LTKAFSFAILVLLFPVLLFCGNSATLFGWIAYYHFYDPATQFADYGTANTNVLYVKDGFLQGSFIKRNGSANKYKVTSVRLNK
jgi:hypothetical protein